MAFSFHPMLSLRQLTTLKLATIVYDDPEIKDIVQKHGSISFVFPSEQAVMYMHEKKEVRQTWRREDVFSDALSILPLSDTLALGSYHKYSTEGDSRIDILPFRSWEELVEKKISSLLLPPTLRLELLEMIRSVSIEIDRWIRNYSFLLKSPAEIAYTAQCYFQWNSLGRIDRVETARSLIRNEAANIEDLYILALLYDLMDDMLMDENKQIECKKFSYKYEDLHGRHRTDVLKKTSIGESGFCFISQRNLFTLNPKRGTKFLILLLVHERLKYEDLMFCLPQMDFDDRKELFKCGPSFILKLFLDWPLQGQFLDAAKLLLPYFTADNFCEILRVILYERIYLGRKDFDYIRLLKEFWSESSSEFKEFVKTQSIYKLLMFSINHPDGETFPKGKHFEISAGRYLTFGYQEIQYCLIKIPLSHSWDRVQKISLDTYPNFPKHYLHYFKGKLDFCCCDDDSLLTSNLDDMLQFCIRRCTDRKYSHMYMFRPVNKRKHEDMENDE